MDVAVFAKQIPNTENLSEIDQATKTLVRDGVPVLDDSDTYSVEIALQLAESSGGGDVVLISMAPNDESAGLRSALAMGASRAILVSDPALQGSDALGTAKVLAAAVRRSGASLVLGATESTDGYTGTVPVQVAELLGWPAVSFAKHVELAGDLLRAQRQTEDGSDEIECPLPAVVTVTAGSVEPRYPSFKGIMSAKSKPVEALSLGDLGIDPSEVGTGGAREVVLEVLAAPSREAGRLVTDDGQAHEAILSLLQDLKAI